MVAPREKGFTLVELIAVLTVIAAISVVIVPRLSLFGAFNGAKYHDEIVSALRHAQASAVNHRRLVCVTITTQDVTMTVAASNPASNCSSNALPAADGSSQHARSAQSSVTSSITSPAGSTVLHFQPDGRVTTDAAGISASNFTVAVTDAENIQVSGRTGFAR